MALDKLVCPECSKVLRPARPVEPGKKVRCPSCEVIFVAGGEEEEDEDRPARKPARAAKAKPKAKKAAASADEEEVGTYGVARDESEEDDKPRIDYAPDMSIKDLRGPAIALVMPPTNKLTLAGFIGVFGGLALIVLLTIPALLPVTDPLNEARTVLADYASDRPLSKEKEVFSRLGGQLKENKPRGTIIIKAFDDIQKSPNTRAAIADEALWKLRSLDWYSVYFIPFGWLTDQPWYLFLLWLVPFVLLTLYSAVICMGSIKAQRLESRGWGIASAIMALFPLNTFCANVALAIIFKTAIMMVLDVSDDLAIYLLQAFTVLSSLLYPFSLISGIWTLVTLNNEDVIAGFEYEGE